MGVVTFKKLISKTDRLDRILIIVAIVGVVLAFISFFRGILIDSQVQVEYLSGGESTGGEQVLGIYVDIEGSVINPGVYRLVDGSRIIDVLIMAGGYSESADREFCEMNLNMAEIVRDGQKIYIPKLSNTDAEEGYAKPISGVNKVSINTASISELDTLKGIGPVRAESIVKNRPYQSLEELVSKGAISQSLLDQNRDQLSLF